MAQLQVHSQLEVDFVIGDEVAIEVKATERLRKNDLKGLRALADELPLSGTQLREADVIC